MELDSFIIDLLHINDVENNSLLDLGAKPQKAYRLSHADYIDFGEHIISTAKRTCGKPASTVLAGSALLGEQIVGKMVSSLEWRCLDGTHDPSSLDKFISGAYKAISQKGNNPLFLGVGAIKWKLAGKKDNIITAVSPLLVYPIRLIRSVNTAPVSIEFINDDVYLNPCFVAKLQKVFPLVAEKFPHPNGEVDLDEPVDTDKLGDGKAYFDTVTRFTRDAVGSDDTVFEFDGNSVVIAPYEHNELCMYYDIRKRRAAIDAHPLIDRIFNKREKYTVPSVSVEPEFIRPRDTAQERIVRRIVGGESLIVKGPPGTGKTHTIINTVAALIAAGKKVLLSSAKLSALSEVYQQMPDELRDYCMLLECETEAEAAKLNPSSVKKDLRDLVEKRKGVRSLPPSVHETIRRSRAEKSEAARSLSEYVRETFEDRSILGYTYYEALDKVCAFSDEVDFASGAELTALSQEKLGDLTVKADKAGEALKKATASGKYPFKKCPWAPNIEKNAMLNFFACDKEKAIKVYSELKKESEQLSAAIKTVEQNCGVQGLKLSYAPALNGVDFDKEKAKAILEALAGAGAISAALDLFRACEKAEYKSDGIDAQAHAEFAFYSRHDLDLSIDDARKISEKIGLLSSLTDEAGVDRLFAFVDRIEKINEEIRELNKTVSRAFDFSELTEGDKEKIDKLSAKFGGLLGAPEKPTLAMRGAYKKLSKFSYLPDIEFAEVARAAIARCDIVARIASVRETEREISRVFGRRMDETDLNAVNLVVGRCAATGTKYADYVKWLTSYNRELFACADGLKAGGDATVGAVVRSIKYAAARDKLIESMSSLDGTLDISSDNAAHIAALAVALSDIKHLSGKEDDEAAELAVDIAVGLKSVAAKADKLIEKMSACSGTLFASFYSSDADELTATDLDIFCELALDRDVLGAATEFCNALTVEEGGVKLLRFFAPFISGERAFGGETDFGEIFKMSAVAIATDYFTAKLGDRKNGVGRRVFAALDGWAKAEKAQDEATVKKIAADCMSKIDPKDRDFDFLDADKGFDTTLRRLFKNRAREILKLKKVFLLSASTASVLLGNDEYSAFDVVIVDEASQLEPVCALPVVSRAKQVVLVGDEMQMPPIHHFGGREEKTEEDSYGETVVLTGDLSVLGLALTNEAFPVEALTAHFRSRTEALIAFSQERYYPYMRTFPSAVPRANGLGFKDVLVKDGYCDGGVNSAEAKAVVAELKAHFDEYFTDGKLTESVGVVAFGVQQINAITSLVERDKDLSGKIDKALAAFEDLPENLIFFKTIETVQGQETDHLILSVTYGRNKDGKIVQSYGELNRGDLGERIFNVAVTRAKSSVTVIHSVEPVDIRGENVRYIGEYIKLAESFALAEDSVFSRSGGDERHGFFMRVKQCLTSLGIDEKRIVFDCGVTEGSVRIPVAVLSPDLKSAEIGIWCETPPRANEPYIDENSRYYHILEGRGWKMHRICIRDFVYNTDAEVKRLAAAINACVTGLAAEG
ncbi:MAG: DUF4011 domain-containing protein [Clostridiales bacterium]|nr:DUF4011 domain-containing protein [Clostridiales bacterium]